MTNYQQTCASQCYDLIRLEQKNGPNVGYTTVQSASRRTFLWAFHRMWYDHHPGRSAASDAHYADAHSESKSDSNSVPNPSSHARGEPFHLRHAGL
jgi:hypothetical protein